MNMEEKLELKHLAPYLPYGLRAINLHGKEVELLGLSNGNNSVSNHLWVFRENDKTGNYFQGYLYECKPLLHPLDRLTEPILEGGKIPERELGMLSFETDALKKGKEINLLTFWRVEKLFEWHFDVFGLIPKGLALPIDQK